MCTFIQGQTSRQTSSWGGRGILCSTRRKCIFQSLLELKKKPWSYFNISEYCLCKKTYSDKILVRLSQLEEENYSFGAASVFCHLLLFFPSHMVVMVDEEVPRWITKTQLGYWVIVFCTELCGWAWHFLPKGIAEGKQCSFKLDLDNVECALFWETLNRWAHLLVFIHHYMQSLSHMRT